MNGTAAFIGTGNMGGALIQAACRALDPTQVIITNRTMAKAEQLAETLGCCIAASNGEAIEAGEYIFLGVKPQMMGDLLEEIAPTLKTCLARGEKKILITMAAGLKIAYFQKKLADCGENVKIIRIMPNMPVSIGQGLVAVSVGEGVSSEEAAGLLEILSKAGMSAQIGENQMDQFCVVGGCAPAFVYMFIEALADGAVRSGLPRVQAQAWAAQTVLGSAAMVLETGDHPGALKDAVCSPAGSTIAGVAALEEHGFRSAVIEAFGAAYARNVEIGKQK